MVMIILVIITSKTFWITSIRDPGLSLLISHYFRYNKRFVGTNYKDRYRQLPKTDHNILKSIIKQVLRQTMHDKIT